MKYVPVAGTTRDRRETKAKLGKLEFTLIDTGGLEEAPKTAIEAAMKEQAMAAVKTADVVLFVVDALNGIEEDDRIIANWARRQLNSNNVVLLGNKVNGAVFLYYFLRCLSNFYYFIAYCIGGGLGSQGANG